MKKCVSFVIISLVFMHQLIYSQSSDPNQSTTSKQYHASYSGGWYAPLGLMVGPLFKHGHGLFFDARCNFNILKTSQYHFDGTSLSDKSLSWQYNQEKVYSRWEANAGVLINTLHLPNGFGVKTYVGGGILQPRYLYQFKHTGGFSSNLVWVEYKEISKMKFNTELGVLLFFNREFNAQIGLSGLTVKHERMLTFWFGKEI